jgi:threonine/homoserine/homoserine lactone efflux protein
MAGINPAMTHQFKPVPIMSLQVYLAFVAACIALALLPGPMVTLVIANGLRHGTRAALINIAGAQLGLAIVIGVVAIGLTSLMATMGYWFDWVRFAGAAYLVWLGVKLIRFPVEASAPTSRHRRRAAASSCRGCWCCCRTPRCWCSLAPSFRSSWT